jgi:DNA polymerase-3 subunit epsilon
MTAIVLDTETTGFDPDNDRIIEICIVPWDADAADPLLHTLVNPLRPIPALVTEITKITDADVAYPVLSFEAHAEKIRELVESAEAVVGYNVAFDKRMIDASLRRCGHDTQWPIAVCAKRVWDIYEPREKRDLTNAYRRFVNKDGFDGAHGASADTLATRAVLRAQFDAFNLHGTPWDQLDPDRKRWWGDSSHVVITDGVLIANFGKHAGRPVDEIDAGFWQWLVKKDFPGHVVMLGLKIIEFVVNHRSDDVMTRRRRVSEWAMAYAEKK